LVGRLLAFKGGALALRAVAAAPEWRLVVCGDGPDEVRLRRLSRHLGLDDRVRFEGWLSRSDVLARMAEADALLFPSLHDESPATVLEARLSGLDVVCLDWGGAETLAGDRAVVVPASGGTAAVVRRLAAALDGLPRPGPTVDQGLEAFSLDARAAVLAAPLRRLLELDGASRVVGVGGG
jgi:glycosyltransferase involved in cell wall biosynthesis